MSDSGTPSLPRENVYGHAKKARLVREALDRLRQERGRPLDVLDVGCGNGAALTRFLGASGDRVLGIDTHAPSIEYAQRAFRAPGLEFRAQGVESLLDEARRFDAVIYADVLEHLPGPQAALAHGIRVLQPGGRVLVTIPNGYGPFEVESWLSRLPVFGKASLWVFDHFVAALNRFVFRGAWTEVVTPPDLPYNAECGHVQFFTRRRLLQMAGDVGLRPLRTVGLSWLSGPYTNYLWAPSRAFCELNTRLPAVLPFWFVSAWFFELAPARPVPAEGRKVDR